MYGNRLFEFVRIVLKHAGKEWNLLADILVDERNNQRALRGLSLDGSMRSLFVGAEAAPARTMRSGDEEAFQKYFLKRSPRWRLEYEGAILSLGMQGKRILRVPDFVAWCSDSSVEVFIEIVGFWRQEYLEKKIEKLRLLGERRFIVIVNRKLLVTHEELSLPSTDLVRVFFYSGREELKEVADRVVEELHRISG